MEPLRYPKQMLTSFGIQCTVLPYYGFYNDWEMLLRGLSTETRKFWFTTKKAFWNLFQQYSLSIMMYKPNFDRRFAEYILNEEWDRNWYLSVLLSAKGNSEETHSGDSYNLFLEFLREVRQKRLKLNFHSIRFLDLPEDLNLINKIIREIDELGWDRTAIKFTDFWLNKSVVGEETKFDYIDRITKPYSLQLTTKCRSLLVSNQIIEYWTNSEVELYPETVWFDKKAEFDESKLNIPKSIVQSTRTVTFEHKGNAEKLSLSIMQLSSLFKNADTINVISNLFFDHELNSVIEQSSHKRVGYECKFCSEYDMEFIQNRCVLWYKDISSKEIFAISAERVELKAFFRDAKKDANGLVCLRSISKIKLVGAKKFEMEAYHYNKIKDYVDNPSCSAFDDSNKDILFILDDQYTHKQQVKITNQNSGIDNFFVGGKSLHLICTQSLLDIPKEGTQKLKNMLSNVLINLELRYLHSYDDISDILYLIVNLKVTRLYIMIDITQEDEDQLQEVCDSILTCIPNMKHLTELSLYSITNHKQYTIRGTLDYIADSFADALKGTAEDNIQDDILIIRAK